MQEGPPRKEKEKKKKERENKGKSEILEINNKIVFFSSENLIMYKILRNLPKKALKN